jgi:hypothetical protein
MILAVGLLSGTVPSAAREISRAARSDCSVLTRGVLSVFLSQPCLTLRCVTRPPARRAYLLPNKTNGFTPRRGGMGQHSDVDTGESEWIDQQVPKTY